MQLAATDKVYVYVPVYGPAGTDLTAFAVDLALTPEQDPEPPSASSDWSPATWTATGPRELEGSGSWARLLVDASAFAPGAYMLRARLHAPPEQPVLESGRVRIGASS